MVVMQIVNEVIWLVFSVFWYSSGVVLLNSELVIVQLKFMFSVCMWVGNSLVFIMVLIEVQLVRMIKLIVSIRKVISGLCWLGSLVIRYQVYSMLLMLKNISRFLCLMMFDSQLLIGCSIIRKVSMLRLIRVLVIMLLSVKVFWIIFGLLIEQVQNVMVLSVVIRKYSSSGCYWCMNNLYIELEVLVLFVLVVLMEFLFSDLFIVWCSQNIMIVVILLMLKVMCQFYLEICGLFQNMSMVSSVSCVSIWLLIRVMQWNEDRKLCWFGMVVLDMQVVLVLYLLLVVKFCSRCVNSRIIVVQMLICDVVGVMVIRNEQVVMIVIEMVSVRWWLQWLVKWLKYYVLIGCIRKVVVKIVQMQSVEFLLVVEKNCDLKYIVNIEQMQMLYYLIRLLVEFFRVLEMEWCRVVWEVVCGIVGGMVVFMQGRGFGWKMVELIGWQFFVILLYVNDRCLCGSGRCFVMDIVCCFLG